MNELGWVLAVGFVSLVILIWILAVQLVRANQQCYDAVGDSHELAAYAMEHALSINSDARAHMRARVEADQAEFLLREAREKARIAGATGLEMIPGRAPPREDDVKVALPSEY